MFTIYRAKRILTMNPSRPEADHVAVRDGMILGVGSLSELAGWGAYQLDETFADKVLMPGLIEGHSHVMEGTFWRYTYCGFFDRMDPSGKVWAGLPSITAVIDRLKQAGDSLQDPTAAIPAGGSTRSISTMNA